MGAGSSSLEVRVLTMAAATARQARMTDVLSAAKGLGGVHWAFFHGIPLDGSGLRYDDATAVAVRGRTLSAAELSCFASHYAIARDWLSVGASDYLLVLEDDVYVDPWFAFDEAARLMQAVGMDYLRCYARAVVPVKLLVYQARFQVIRFPWSPGGTQAYILSRRGARRFVAMMEANPLIVRPIDDQLDRSWESGNAVYGLHPWPVMEYNVATTVHSEDQVESRHLAQRQLARPDRLDRLRSIVGRVDLLRERLRRRLSERRLSRADASMTARVKLFVTAPGYRSFKPEA